jgi:hypothetical protein
LRHFSSIRRYFPCQVWRQLLVCGTDGPFS